MASKCAIILLIFVSLNALVCCNADSFLLSGNVLIGGSSLRNKDYVFTMQRDCNLVLYDRGNPIWVTSTGGLASNCYCYLGNDGNLMIKTLVDAKVIWSSKTQEKGKHIGNYALVLQKDRNVVMYGPAIWATAINAASAMSITKVMNINVTDNIALSKKNETDNVLVSGSSLSTGSTLQIKDYVLIMQEDCNLVIYDRGQPIWATNTGGLARNCICYLGNDGNLMVRTSFGGRIIWSSNTRRSDISRYVLVLQRDRNLVIYGPAIDASNTNLPSHGMSITKAMKINESSTSV
ncbi:Mannose-binding lectin [Thalictrum thalictroides]|uniref:Mannose-binding lectin n=1 Tax=Thalictrum thalictroides TaxID=46969 RepID=A0A7J6WYY8_THATH|nr:Mannose-binding lectin [Thalictrum thalictroides]